MSVASDITRVSTSEIMIVTMARMLDGLRHVAVGASSPVPGSAALLTRARSKGYTRVSILGSRKNNPFTDGARELFDCAGQGRIDAFFLSGGQIDGQANINLVGIGEHPGTKARFPGSFGSAYMYFAVPRVILFREEHSRRTLVEKVDFISAPGKSAPNVWRQGGPKALVTGRCVFSFDGERFRLDSVHPGHSVDEVVENTGFAFDCPAEVGETPLPDPQRLALLRGEIAGRVAEFYPEFAARVFGGPSRQARG